MPCCSKGNCPISALVSKVTSAAPEEKVGEVEQRLARFLGPASELLKFLLAGAFVKNWVALAADILLSLVVLVLAFVLPHNLLFNLSLLYLLGFLASIVYEKLLRKVVAGAVAKADGIDAVYERAVHTVAAVAAGCGAMCCAACRGAGEKAEKVAKASKAEGLLEKAKAAMKCPHVRLALVCLVVLPLSLLISLKAIVVATVLLLDGIAIARYLTVSGTIDKVAGQVKKQASKVKAAAESKIAEGKQAKQAKPEKAEKAAEPAEEAAEDAEEEQGEDDPGYAAPVASSTSPV